MERAVRSRSEIPEEGRAPPAGNKGFTGTVNLQLNDLIQMVCLSRSDLSIQVTSSLGNGTIFVREGEIRHAQTEVLHGECAFFEILRWRDGQFSISLAEDHSDTSVDKPWEHLLLEAMRRRDEDVTAHHTAVLADFDENCFPSPECHEFEEELDQVFEGLTEGFGESGEESARDQATSCEEAKIVRVLVIDDSPFFANQIKKMLEERPGMEVAAIACNGKEALDVLDRGPGVDVITLDIEMPIMQGDTTLKHIMVRHPIPAVTISSLQADSLPRIFEFLQAGAVDFLPKPGARDDLRLYADRLRDLVLKVSRAKVGQFRRWRKSRVDPTACSHEVETPRDRILLVIGAEGAHMDWFRLPLHELTGGGILLGLQRIVNEYLLPFCRLLEDATSASVLPLLESAPLRPECLHLGNASCSAEFAWAEAHEPPVVSLHPPRSLPWESGIKRWLVSLARTAGQRLSILCLSGSGSLPPDLVCQLIESGARFILLPRDSVVCTELIDSVLPYELLYPRQVIQGSLQNLAEVWLCNEPCC